MLHMYLFLIYMYSVFLQIYQRLARISKRQTHTHTQKKQFLAASHDAKLGLAYHDLQPFKGRKSGASLGYSEEGALLGSFVHGDVQWQHSRITVLYSFFASCDMCFFLLGGKAIQRADFTNLAPTWRVPSPQRWSGGQEFVRFTALLWLSRHGQVRKGVRFCPTDARSLTSHKWMSSESRRVGSQIQTESNHFEHVLLDVLEGLCFWKAIRACVPLTSRAWTLWLDISNIRDTSII